MSILLLIDDQHDVSLTLCVDIMLIVEMGWELRVLLRFSAKQKTGIWNVTVTKGIDRSTGLSIKLIRYYFHCTVLYSCSVRRYVWSPVRRNSCGWQKVVHRISEKFNVGHDKCVEEDKSFWWKTMSVFLQTMTEGSGTGSGLGVRGIYLYHL